MGISLIADDDIDLRNLHSFYCWVGVAAEGPLNLCSNIIREVRQYAFVAENVIPGRIVDIAECPRTNNPD
jgi:hypothetical protein